MVKTRHDIFSEINKAIQSGASFSHKDWADLLLTYSNATDIGLVDTPDILEGRKAMLIRVAAIAVAALEDQIRKESVHAPA